MEEKGDGSSLAAPQAPQIRQPSHHTSAMWPSPHAGQDLGSSLAGQFWPESLERWRPGGLFCLPGLPWTEGLSSDARWLPGTPGLPQDSVTWHLASPSEWPEGARKQAVPLRTSSRNPHTVCFAIFSSLDVGRIQLTPKEKGLSLHLSVDMI